MRYHVFTVLAAASLAVGMPARAQGGPGAAAPNGPGWLPRVSFLDNPDQAVPVTTAERVSVAARLAAIEAEFLRIAAIERPQGFEAKAAFGWDGGQFTVRDLLIGSSYSLAFAAPSFGHRVDPARPIVVYVNPSGRTLARDQDVPLAVDEDGGEIYLEQFPGRAIPGATAVYEYEQQERPTRPEGITTRYGGKVAVLFTAGGASPWLAVSRERYLKAMIIQVEGKNQETLKEMKGAASQTPYEQWMAGAAERRKEREASMAMVTDKAAAAKALEALEKTEREVTASLKASEAKDREFSARMTTNMLGDQFRAQIAAMPPAERAQTAWMAGGMLVSPDAPGARRMVTLNPAFYRTRGSPLQARAILVILKTGGYASTSPGQQGWLNVDRAVVDAYARVNWAAFVRMVATQ